jgi:hypothetical protein
VRIIKDRIKATQDKQKKYASMKVAPWKHMLRFGMKGKLAPRFIGPFEIRKHIGPVAYEINLPS